ncbi:hypothetical protein [Flavihumibacter petaseus]|uniref:Uncharacterized protein n=1 Tax=Flavihumibacter petaseus NBRC 106054 TaxID=1220578 RepID=A0A0E9MYL1_9BACT|nr:hypothetical protein [Flavihumibacter petaseus]GAO42215.1 hypothetical protein FPE01S_01_12280 [Flavihumibacter petaseus NBRC 106054]
MKKLEPTLPLCLLLDAIGYFTYAIPVLGEFGDLLWAPVSGILFYRLFGGWKGALGGVFSFAEELLPFTDFIPSFTIGWFMMRLGRKNQADASQALTVTNSR